MLMILHPATAKRGSIWRPGAAYTIVRDDAEIGRIDVNSAPERDGASSDLSPGALIRMPHSPHGQEALDLRSRAMGDVFRGYRAAWRDLREQHVLFDRGRGGSGTDPAAQTLQRPKHARARVGSAAGWRNQRGEGPAATNAPGASDRVRYNPQLGRDVRTPAAVDLRPGPLRPGYGIGIIEPQCHRIEDGARGPSPSVAGGPTAQSKVQMVNEVHAAWRDRTLRQTLGRMRHDGGGGRAEKVELLSGIEGQKPPGGEHRAVVV